MLIMVYIHRKHAEVLSEVAVESVGCGVFGMMGNKGAVGIRFKLYDSYFTFVNSHLAADVNQVDRRNSNYLDICKRLAFGVGGYTSFMEYSLSNPWVSTHMDTGFDFWNLLPGSMTPNVVPGGLPVVGPRKTCTMFDCDHLFWIGDLNYRIPIPEDESKAILQLNPNEMGVSQLMEFDQLNREKQARRAFVDFEEQKVTFLPTYKYDVGSNSFDSR